jgi:cyclopropane-fatty-acyl-phospholipid synthase
VINKLEYILDACRLSEGSRVLDVGAGWGAFERFAGRRGVDSTMLTLSHQQRRYLERFASTHDMPCNLEVRYANIYEFEPTASIAAGAGDGRPRGYDAIVLLGVMEHLPDYERLFRRFEKLLVPNGRVYMDFAANRRKFKVRSFTYRYVFPGNHTPVVLPDLLRAANETAFEPIAVHNDRHSYYLTLRAWARRLEAARERLAAEFGEKVFRLFQMYLWGCAHQMRSTGTLESYRVVFQKSAATDSSNVGVCGAL